MRPIRGAFRESFYTAYAYTAVALDSNIWTKMVWPVEDIVRGMRHDLREQI